MKEKKSNTPVSCEKNCRLGKVGGSAVMEGVMMKSENRYAVAVRQEDGSITLKEGEVKPIKEKYPILGLPIIRGLVNFIEMMMLSYKTLSISADAFIGEVEEETKFEKWMKEKLGAKATDVIMVIAMILGVCLGVGIFMYLPDLAVTALKAIFKAEFKYTSALIAGIIRIGIFVLYIWLVSKMEYIRRTFEFHGAEHKSIACYEAGEELTAENAKKHTRFHPRCGTSFIFVLLLLSIIVFTLVFLIPGTQAPLTRLLLRILLLPLIVGIGYEFIKYAGAHDNAFIRLCSAPGLWMQRITTREPDEAQLEIAIISLMHAMPSVFTREQVDETVKKFDRSKKEEPKAEDNAEAAEPQEEAKAEEENSAK